MTLRACHSVDTEVRDASSAESDSHPQNIRDQSGRLAQCDLYYKKSTDLNKY